MVEIDDRQERLTYDRERLVAVGELASQRLLGVEVETSVVVCDDPEIAALHQQYLGEPGPTDVISFPQLDLYPGGPAPAAGALLGDVVISIDTAARQAAELAGWSLDRELALLLVHGILHLCGYNDLTAADRETMRRLEDELLGACGLPPAPRPED